MDLTLNLDIAPLPQPITYNNGILLIGSCFTEHMADRLAQHKFNILSNPHGILFNPLSVAKSLDSYIEHKEYKETDLFQLNELWNSWAHHTRFSHIDQIEALKGINETQASAANMVKKADWVVITLGSAYQYYLKEDGKAVANNHRAPSQWFEKRLLSTEVVVNELSATLGRLFAANPNVQVLFTISPVRHIRDGVVNNNRSKARLIDAVHSLVEQHERAYYFPAYELIIDILRDYRFYDIDFVHPNFMATSFVWEQFVKSCIAPQTAETMKLVKDITTARAHKTRFPDTDAHSKFLASYAEKTKTLHKNHPYLNLDEELVYFSSVNGEII